MPTDRSLLLVIADGEHARFVRPAPDYALHTETEIDSESAHKRSSDLSSDRPGASFHSDSSAHHAVAPRHDAHELAMTRFAQSIAAQVNQAAGTAAFEELVLVAPAHTLHAIQQGLDRHAKARLIGTLDKDLVKTPDHELWPHVSAWVRPVHRQS